jgi:hypothetical protein
MIVPEPCMCGALDCLRCRPDSVSANFDDDDFTDHEAIEEFREDIDDGDPGSLCNAACGYCGRCGGC